MSITDRRDGVTEGVAMKRPVRVAATANLTLSGLQTIDGVALDAGDANLRVLVTGQTDATQNGVYDASSGVWERAKDFDGAYDIVNGTLIFVTDGTVYGRTVFRVDTDDPIVVGMTGLSIIHYPTLLADDLLAVEGLTTTGLATRTAANTWATRSIAAGSAISITNGNGVAGNPTVALDINSLLERDPDYATDYLVMYDASDLGNRKVGIDNLLGGLRPLTASTTFWVRTDGSDSNTGLTDSAAGAFLTWQGAWNAIAGTYNFNGEAVTLRAGGSGARTFTNASGSILVISGWIGGGTLSIIGDTATPANVALTSTGADCIRFDNGANIPNVTINGFDIETVTSGYGINNAATCHVAIGANMIFGACAGSAQLAVTWRTAQIHTGAYTINGSCTRHIDCDAGILQLNSGTYTVSGTPAFSGAFARFRNHGCLISDATWSGAATGKRFDGQDNAFCNVAAGGLTYFPGSVDGTVVGGAVYSGSVMLMGASQIAFPAAQSVSSNANTLDDYEEGTFTPAITINGSGTTPSTQEGSYTKIGNAVSIRLRIALTNNGAGVGAAIVTGLPFSAAVLTALTMYIDNTDAARAWIPVTSGTAILLRYTGAGATNATDVQITDTVDIAITGVYFV